MLMITNKLRAQAESWRTILSNKQYVEMPLPNDKQKRSADQIASQALSNLKNIKNAYQEIAKNKSPKIVAKLHMLGDQSKEIPEIDGSLSYNIAETSGVIADEVDKMVNKNKTVELNNQSEITVQDLTTELVNDNENRIKLIENGYKELAKE